VAILRGTGDLTFAETSSVPLDTPNEVAAARLPGGRHVDLAVTRFDPGGLWLLRGDGHGAFAAGDAIPAPPGAGSLAAGDFHRDRAHSGPLPRPRSDQVARPPA